MREGSVRLIRSCLVFTEKSVLAEEYFEAMCRDTLKYFKSTYGINMHFCQRRRADFLVPHHMHKVAQNFSLRNICLSVSTLVKFKA